MSLRLTAISFALFIAAAACSKPSGTGGAPSASAPASSAAAAPSAVSLGAPPKIGVAACDDYFDVFYKCVAKMPEEQQKRMMDDFQASLPGWKGLAVRPDNRAVLEADCKRALEGLGRTPLCREAMQ